ncbi:uncharacterized protein FOMMEDRAFT_23059 [Fomitiporia mediterranea MF3/22]|uniref:uncharacterized protein n=1 Tax=Fomitiporia mediterranea (strain MF3/22) TaxID=694068 RepID=UPI00044077EE|nr:uncharacterized protein FOMMEDRAFT_23059 [Fomitiporia mediterranea MF3/22]EJC99146.1 hypothetical protein FOMMEDRAFT_23059 [Fomitiporia mediterranea MF3/22]
MSKNLRALADEAVAQDPPVLIAYEMWAWGTYVEIPGAHLDICRRIDRPNFGLCLDTSQMSVTHLASEICLPNALSPSNVPPPSASLSESFTGLTHTLSRHTDKIFYLQISDGSRIDSHVLEVDAKAQGIHSLYAYSNAYRPLPFQKVSRPGFLPVLDVMRGVLATGLRGPWSYETKIRTILMFRDAGLAMLWILTRGFLRN